MTAGPYDLNTLLAQHRALAKKEKPEPCPRWCTMAQLEGRTYAGAMGDCTCTEPCQWERCPMDVEHYVPPPVPQFRRQAEIRAGAIDEIAEALGEAA